MGGTGLSPGPQNFHGILCAGESPPPSTPSITFIPEHFLRREDSSLLRGYFKGIPMETESGRLPRHWSVGSCLRCLSLAHPAEGCEGLTQASLCTSWVSGWESRVPALVHGQV